MNNNKNNINVQIKTDVVVADTNQHCDNGDSTINSDVSGQSKSKDNQQSFAFVEFKGKRRELILNHKNLTLVINDKIVVTTEIGCDLGFVTYIIQDEEQNICKRLNRNVIKTVIRKATEQDLDKEYTNRCDEEEVIYRTSIITQSFGLDMKVIDAEWQFDRQKLTIFFTAPQRVDFRELVKDLARQFKTRIELRQISAREEMKRIGTGLGCCGQTMCCISFLNDFYKITTEHAKAQQLSTNASKLSGNCRRLKCCMVYEYDYYAKELEKYPAMYSTIENSNNVFNLVKIDIFKNEVTLFSRNEKKYSNLKYDELEQLLKNSKVIQPEIIDSRNIIDDDVIIDDEF